METLTTRTVTIANDVLQASDQVVLFNCPGTDVSGFGPSNFVIPDSDGSGRRVILKNIGETDIIIQINGLADLSVPRLNGGTKYPLHRFDSIQLLAYAANKWIKI